MYNLRPEDREQLRDAGFTEWEIDAIGRRELTPEMIMEHDKSLLEFLEKEPHGIRKLVAPPKRANSKD